MQHTFCLTIVQPICEELQAFFILPDKECTWFEDSH